MKKHDLVFIRPTTSLKFGRRWGVIGKIVPEDGLPYKVNFHDTDIRYGFCDNDLIDTRTYEEWLEVGKQVFDITDLTMFTVTKKEYHFVYRGNSSEPIHFTDVLPITHCRDCSTQMVGSFEYTCEDCQYGGVING